MLVIRSEGQQQKTLGSGGMGIQLSEPAIVPDTFCSDVYEVEDLGEGNYRITFFTTQRSTYDGQGSEHVVVSRLVLTTSAALRVAQRIMQATGVQCCGGERLRKLTH
jgi:hypothetical protein